MGVSDQSIATGHDGFLDQFNGLENDIYSPMGIVNDERYFDITADSPSEVYKVYSDPPPTNVSLGYYLTKILLKSKIKSNDFDGKCIRDSPYSKASAISPVLWQQQQQQHPLLQPSSLSYNGSETLGNNEICYY
uniref:Isoleucine--tRNA ligase n=1 Tax=Lygus hesperus TaxID=30085 RepID=A0A0A9WFJ7_LYGHE